MDHKKKPDNTNCLIKITIKLDNVPYKQAIGIQYSNFHRKTRLQYRQTNYQSRKQRANKEPNNSY